MEHSDDPVNDAVNNVVNNVVNDAVNDTVNEPEPEPEPEPVPDLTHISGFPINLRHLMNQLINQPVMMHSGIDIEENINPFMNNILQRSMDEEPKDKPCSKEFINNLIINKVTKEMVDNEIHCSICCDKLELNESVIQLPCQETHFFHIKKDGICDGLYPWLKTHNTCPICRTEFPEEVISTNNEEGNDEDNGEDNGEGESEDNMPDINISINLLPVIPNLRSVRRIIGDIIEEEEERMAQEAIYSSLQ